MAERWPSGRWDSEGASVTSHYHEASTSQGVRISQVREELKLQSEVEIDKYLTPVKADLARQLMKDSQVYPMSKPVRGRAIIVNIEWYQDKHMLRSPSYIDAQNLRNLFEALYFNTDVWSHCSLEELRKKLNKERERGDHKDAQAFILVVLSHGQEGHVICSDGRSIPIDEITSYFDASRCKHLKGKPKVFIIQAYQEVREQEEGPKRQSFTSDSAAPASPSVKGSERIWQPLHDKADMVVVCSTMTGHPSWRYDTLGTLFIREFVLHVMLHAHDHHLMEILQEIRNHLVTTPEPFIGAIQMPTERSTLLRNLYFFPGYKEEN